MGVGWVHVKESGTTDLGERDTLDRTEGRKRGLDVLLRELEVERADIDTTGQLLVAGGTGCRLQRQLLLLEERLHVT